MTSLDRAPARLPKARWIGSLLCGVILIGIVPRLAYVGRPYFLDFHAWRQSDSAAFTHGYLVDSFNPFDPSIDRYPCAAIDAHFGRVEAELPIVPFLAALPLKLLGLDDASALYLRLVSIAVFAWGCWLLFCCVQELGGDAADALLAVAAFGAAPLCIFFTRSPQPDGQSLTLAIGAVWCSARYARSRNLSDAVAAAGFATGLLLLKISNAYLMPVLAYVLWARLGARAVLRDRTLWLLLLLACGATAAWYAHAHGFAWTFGIWGDKFTDLHVARDPATWQKLVARLNWDVLTLAGVTLAAVGFATSQAALWVRVATVWLTCAALFVVLTLGGQLKHVYYQLCLVPPAGVRYLFSKGYPARVALLGLLAIHCAITASVLWGPSDRASVEGRSYFAEESKFRAPIDALRKLVPNAALIVSSERDPRLYWNSRHRGYFLASETFADVMHCMDRASDYLLLGASARTRLASQPAFKDTFTELWRDERYGLYQRLPTDSARHATDNH